MFVPIDEQFCFKPLRLKKRMVWIISPLFWRVILGFSGFLIRFIKQKAEKGSAGRKYTLGGVAYTLS